MTAEMDARARRRLEEQGWEFIAPDEGMEAFGAVLRSGVPQMGIMGINWSRFVAQFPRGTVPPFFDQITRAAPADDPTPGPTESPSELIERLATLPAADRSEAVTAYLQERVAAIVGSEGDTRPETDVSFTDLGLDSLMHMELRNLVTDDLGAAVPMADFLGSPDIAHLGELLLKHLAVQSLALAPRTADDAGEMEEITL